MITAGVPKNLSHYRGSPQNLGTTWEQTLTNTLEKIQGTLCISRSSIWSKAGRCSHVRKLGPLSRSVDCFFVRPTRRDGGSLQPFGYVGCTTAYALMMSGTRHPRSRYEELWVRVMDVSKYSAQMTQSQETA